MNRIKKVFISLSLFLTNIITKVYAISVVDTLYGVSEPKEPTPTIWEKIIGIGKILMPIIFFVVGVFVIINKKITKKVKAIVISILIILGNLAWIILNYFAEYKA